jgi:hypothetical protein
MSTGIHVSIFAAFLLTCFFVGAEMSCHMAPNVLGLPYRRPRRAVIVGGVLCVLLYAVLVLDGPREPGPLYSTVNTTQADNYGGVYDRPVLEGVAQTVVLASYCWMLLVHFAGYSGATLLVAVLFMAAGWKVERS